MTRQELIQIIERKIAEQEVELKIDRQALTILRGRVVDLPRSKGPIVYGNGHHDGKKPKSIQTQGVKGFTADKVVDILKDHPLGMSLVEIQGILAKKGIHISTSSVYNSFRHRNVVGLKREGQQAMYYKIQPKELLPK